MRLVSVRAVVVLSAVAAPLAAQAPTRLPASGRGTVTGVVYDSLARQPLEGARVWIAGTSTAAISDAGGRFRLDSVAAGARVIAFEHAELDSIGLSNNVRRIQVTANRLTAVELSIPSHTTLRNRLCPRGAATSRDSGIVFGSLLDARSGARLAGGRVVVRWTTAERTADGLTVDRPTTTAQTDSIGNYYVCAVPTQYMFTIQGQAGRFSSGITELLLGERGIARRDLHVGRDSAFAVQDSAGLRGRATIIGVVTDENGNPRPSARAAVDDAAAGETMSDEAGRFVLNGLPAGSHMLMVRMIGYSAARVPVLLRHDDTSRVSVVIRALTVLDTIRVTASQSRMNEILLDELAQRIRTGGGYYLMGEDVKQRQSMRAVLQGMPSLLIEGRTTYNFTIRSMIGGRFQDAVVYVDGLRSSVQAMQSYRPDQIVAIEWYPRGTMAPLRYQSGDLPILLIWTRFMR